MIERDAEIAAIEAHISERGVTRCPAVGSAELIEASLRQMRAERRRWNQHPLGWTRKPSQTKVPAE